ncbi:TPA: hypothetical protein HL443_24270 [Escherichia coli]|nr:hypothetical protein [Escherichia coli]KDW01591.1 hypothetical protein AB85_2428 [Escherichia coli 2-156-04_S3_C1]HAG7432163.1 hypothetical protein [Escherichia coli]HAG8027478.1 hypothetical protein [Escherichia coli]HAJ0427684.1 hypothetical protein [Escherichia coli]
MPAGSVNAKIVDRFGNADDFLDHFIILTRAVGTDIFSSQCEYWNVYHLNSITLYLENWLI